MTPIAPHITVFLQKRLAVERRASPHTCDTYAYAFRLLFDASTQTTDIYLQADPTEKLEALAAMTLPALRPGKFRPPDRLIAALRTSTVMRSSDLLNP